MSAERTLDSSESIVERVGDYRLVHRIEHDDFASVWEAERGSGVRLIQLNAALVDDPDLETAFVQHADLMGGVDHPSVLRVLDSATEGGTSFMVTERAEGVCLAELVVASPDRRVAVSILARILLETCEGLGAIHALPGAGAQRQLIHGDVTPSSLLVNRDGDVVIAPTCLGTVSCRAPGGARSGRLAYKAPEQLAGAEDVDGRADVFALGATFWQALCGNALFRGATVAELVRAVQAGAPSKLPVLGSGPANSVLALLGRMLDADRERRVASCAELSAELERIGGAAPRSELAALAAAAAQVFESGAAKREADPWRLRADGAAQASDRKPTEPQAPRTVKVARPAAIAAKADPKAAPVVDKVVLPVVASVEAVPAPAASSDEPAEVEPAPGAGNKPKPEPAISPPKAPDPSPRSRQLPSDSPRTAMASATEAASAPEALRLRAPSAARGRRRVVRIVGFVVLACAGLLVAIRIASGAPAASGGVDESLEPLPHRPTR